MKEPEKDLEKNQHKIPKVYPQRNLWLFITGRSVSSKDIIYNKLDLEIIITSLQFDTYSAKLIFLME